KSQALRDLDNSLHFNRIALAHSERAANNLTGAEQALGQCKPELRGWEWHYLKRLCEGSLLTLRGHTDSVHCVAVSPDGQFAASGSADKTIRIWDLTTAETVRVLAGLPESVSSLAFSPDGKRLASASRTVVVWDVASGKQALAFDKHRGDAGA